MPVAQARVVFVDGEAVRNDISVDFVEGGNAGRYTFIPRDEVWVERLMTPLDQAATIVHELVERQLMLSRGLKYDAAHDRANAFERKFRKDIVEVQNPESAALEFLASGSKRSGMTYAAPARTQVTAARTSPETLKARWPELAGAVDALAAADPSGSQTYLERALQWVREGADVAAAVEAMRAFHKVKPRLEVKDILKYPTPQSVLAVTSKLPKWTEADHERVSGEALGLAGASNADKQRMIRWAEDQLEAGVPARDVQREMRRTYQMRGLSPGEVEDLLDALGTRPAVNAPWDADLAARHRRLLHSGSLSKSLREEKAINDEVASLLKEKAVFEQLPEDTSEDWNVYKLARYNEPGGREALAYLGQDARWCVSQFYADYASSYKNDDNEPDQFYMFQSKKYPSRKVLMAVRNGAVVEAKDTLDADVGDEAVVEMANHVGVAVAETSEEDDLRDALNAAGLDGSKADEWIGLGFGLDEALEWAAVIDDPDVAHNWHHEHYPDDEFVRAWAPSGFSPDEAQTWAGDGFNAEDAAQLASYSISAETARPWIDAGFAAIEAANCIDQEISMESALKWKPYVNLSVLKTVGNLAALIRETNLGPEDPHIKPLLPFLPLYAGPKESMRANLERFARIYAHSPEAAKGAWSAHSLSRDSRVVEQYAERGMFKDLPETATTRMLQIPGGEAKLNEIAAYLRESGLPSNWVWDALRYGMTVEQVRELAAKEAELVAASGKSPQEVMKEVSEYWGVARGSLEDALKWREANIASVLIKPFVDAGMSLDDVKAYKAAFRSPNVKMKFNDSIIPNMMGPWTTKNEAKFILGLNWNGISAQRFLELATKNEGVISIIWNIGNGTAAADAVAQAAREPQPDPNAGRMPRESHYTAAAFEAAEHTGCMIALYPPEDVAEAVAVRGGEEPESLHVTLAYYKPVPPGFFEQAALALKPVAREQGPLLGRIAGMGRFPASPTSDGKDVIWAPVDVPGLVEFRQAVIAAIEKATGLLPRADHGFTPHMTLIQIEPSEQGPTQPPPSTEVAFEAVWVVQKPRSEAVKFTGNEGLRVVGSADAQFDIENVRTTAPGGVKNFDTLEAFFETFPDGRWFVVAFDGGQIFESAEEFYRWIETQGVIGPVEGVVGYTPEVQFGGRGAPDQMTEVKLHFDVAPSRFDDVVSDDLFSFEAACDCEICRAVGPQRRLANRRISRVAWRLNAAERVPWVAVDLDGTILEESPDIASGAFGRPKQGAKEALRELQMLGWRVSIYTARFGDESMPDSEVQALAKKISAYLTRCGLPHTDVWVGRKPRAMAFVDNRAIQFRGDWAEVIAELTDPNGLAFAA